MDHRCLYGHRVPAAFTFAIQSRTCPTCGAPTLTINGYQVARKITLEAQLDAVAAFQIVRIIEADWVITPPPAPAGESTGTAPPATPPATGASVPPAAAAPEPSTASAIEASPVDEEEVVVDEDVDPMSLTAVPDARLAIKPVLRGKSKTEVDKKEADRREAAKLAGFDPGEEDFFKGN